MSIKDDLALIRRQQISVAMGAFEFERGGVFLNPTGPMSVLIWQAPYACRVTMIRARRSGGTDADAWAGRLSEGQAIADLDFMHLTVALSLSSDETWNYGANIIYADYAPGDGLVLRLESVTGTPDQVVIQVDFRRL